MAQFKMVLERVEKSLERDQPAYANTVSAVGTLAVALARAGEIEKAESWLSKLPAGNVQAVARAEICCARVREANFSAAREILKTLPQNLERLEACRLLAQAELIAAPDQSSDLITWIKAQQHPLDRAAAYAGLVDGLEKKPWNRLAMAWTDDFRRELLIKNGVAGTGGAAPTILARNDRFDYGQRGSFGSNRAQPEMSSILNDVNRGFQIANAVQSFSGGNVQGGVVSLIGAIAPVQMQQLDDAIRQVNQPISEINSTLGSIPGGGYIPSLPGIPGIPGGIGGFF
jgi:hypothetical protein